MNKELKDVACYCRVSTDSENQINSYENQKEYYEEKLSKENGYNLVKMYTDRGVSGTSYKYRDGFNELLKDCGLDIKIVKNKVGNIQRNNTKINYFISNRAPKFKYVFCKNSSRLARHLGIIEIIDMLRVKGVYVVFEDLGRSTEDTSNDLLLSFISVIDSNFSRDLATKVKFGNNQTAKQGKLRIGGVGLYGYNHNKENDSLTIIPEEAEVVKLIYKLRLDGLGSRQIGKYLKERCIKTRKGNDWGSNSICRLLSNEIYTGVVVRNKFDTCSIGDASTRRLRPREEWIVTEAKDRIEPIIDKETYEKVQDIISKSTAPSVGKGKYMGTSELSSKILCESCRKYYTRNSDVNRNKNGDITSKRVFFNCGTKKKHGASVCANPNVQEEKIEKCIENLLKNYDNYARKLLGEIPKLLEDKKNSINIEVNESLISGIEDDLKNERDKQQKILDLYLEDKIDKIALDSRSKIIKDKIEVLELKYKVVTRTRDKRDTILKEIEGQIKLTKNISEKFLEDELTRENLIRHELIFILVKKDGSISPFTRADYMYERSLKAADDLYPELVDN